MLEGMEFVVVEEEEEDMGQVVFFKEYRGKQDRRRAAHCPTHTEAEFDSSSICRRRMWIRGRMSVGRETGGEKL
jgi:hypothetical protein